MGKTKVTWPSQMGAACLNALSRLPLGVHYFMSDWVLYPLVRHVIRYRRRVVRKNLSLSFPDKTESERLDIERRFYHFFCDLAVEIIKVHSISQEELMRRVEWKNLDVVEDAFREGKDFALCYLSHYCNWEWCIGLPLHLQIGGMCQIYHPMRNKVFDRWFLDNRSRYGAVNIPMKQTLRKLFQLRQEMADGRPHTDENGKTADKAVKGYMFGCIADQLPKAENVHHRIPFLHQDTGVFTGSEQIGRKMNMAIFYSRFTRPERGRMCIEFERMDGVVDASSSEFAYTDEYMSRLEMDIKAHPEFWLWTHDRWKR